MGSFASLGLFSKLLPALVAALVFGCWTVLNRVPDESTLDFLPDYSGNLLLEAGVIVSLTLLASFLKPAAEGKSSLWLAPALALWTILPLTWLHHVRAEWGMKGLVALILMSKIGDTAGYFTGNAIGKSHPFPKTSPGKTTAGCVASLLAGTAAGGVCVALGLLPEAKLGVLGGFLCGAVINVAAQAGDLLESRVKRTSGVKDSGTWFGPAGGVLDVTDSLLLTVPVAVLIWPLLLNGLID